MSRVAIADVDRDMIARWRSDSLALTRGYTLRGWEGRCPDELMALLVAAQKGMDDAPLDDLDMAPESLDEEWNRSIEASMATRGRHRKALLAVDPDGEAAGMTEVTLVDDRPWLVIQQGTTTLAPHRNQGSRRA